MASHDCASGKPDLAVLTPEQISELFSRQRELVFEVAHSTSDEMAAYAKERPCPRKQRVSAHERARSDTRRGLE